MNKPSAPWPQARRWLGAALAAGLSGCASLPAALPPHWDKASLDLPESWEVTGGARGDLNRDGRRDIVVLMAAPATIATDGARGSLLVFLSQPDGRYRLAGRNDGIFTGLRRSCAPARCSQVVGIRRGSLQLEETYRLEVGPFLRQQHSRFRISGDRQELLLVQSRFRLGSRLNDHALQVEWDLAQGIRKIRRSAPDTPLCERQDDQLPGRVSLSDFDPEQVGVASCTVPGQPKPMLNFSS
jgi:hypothetical protein